MAAKYDPNEIPKVNPSHMHEAKLLGLFPINVICNELDSTDDEWAGVIFIAYVSRVPAIGETIDLENGKRCRVTEVSHRVARVGEGSFAGLLINVVADELSTRGESTD